ncbi:MAG: DNA polymerase III subunit beta [Deltaproteobacteria bacterium CG_4_10_14_0_2_um_filter_43_8]|nr:MAG: DNA polymerase III subunit beta [Deltaproteobacteria bacterium CG11_big_fil_rev_8_21_14_0_20_42_23]PJA19748.1 MAG: DNA polymerase III subunit beta [Deltaproteobacteria bacterium CG_4_10_14_0_2_um_filter_43_8]PJC64474.1 MAG: DNA polymerase III subunit beta [Deltaproteobacteria bacterium CG_4_9_14_0_2_um_filter_42_21]
MHNVFVQFSDLEKVILFGSRAMGNFKPGSDVDLVLLGELDHSTLLEVKHQLEEEIPLPYFFDVLLESEISNESLKQHVKECGQVIYRR